jgi:hypothetical protein
MTVADIVMLALIIVVGLITVPGGIYFSVREALAQERQSLKTLDAYSRGESDFMVNWDMLLMKSTYNLQQAKAGAQALRSQR